MEGREGCSRFSLEGGGLQHSRAISGAEKKGGSNYRPVFFLVQETGAATPFLLPVLLVHVVAMMLMLMLHHHQSAAAADG